jgi:DNA-binding NtrC family response regulator
MKTLHGTILIADDDVDIRDILKDTLKSLGGTIVTAANGEECLDRVEASGPDLILLDIEMPIMNGLDVLKALKQRGNNAAVIMITAYGTIERAVQAMKQGAYDFITKPFDLDHITLTVEKALERERLKRGLESFAVEAAERYRLIGGESAKMREAIETARKAAASKQRFCFWGKAGRARKSLPAPSTTGVREKTSRSSPSIALVCREICLRASFSVTKEGHLPGRAGSRRARWSWPTAAPCFSMKSAISRRSCKPSCYDFCRSGSLSVWAEPSPYLSMCG